MIKWMFKPKYIIKPKLMGGKLYYMIYREGIFRDIFFERWNTQATAMLRLHELQKEISEMKIQKLEELQKAHKMNISQIYSSTEDHCLIIEQLVLEMADYSGKLEELIRMAK